MSDNNKNEEPTLEQVDIAKERVAADSFMAALPGLLILIVAAIMAFYTNQQSGTPMPLSLVLGVI